MLQLIVGIGITVNKRIPGMDSGWWLKNIKVSWDDYSQYMEK